MSYKTKAEATAAAKVLFKNHGLRGAKVDIWENLGWHIALRHQHYGIWPEYLCRGGIRFTGLVGRDGRGTGEMRYSSDTHFSSRTPREVAQKMLRAVRAELAKDIAFESELAAALRPGKA